MLETVDARKKEMTTELFMVLLHLLIYRVTAKTNQEIPGTVIMSLDDNVDARTVVSGI